MNTTDITNSTTISDMVVSGENTTALVDREHYSCVCDWPPESCKMVYNLVPDGHEWHGRPIEFEDTKSSERIRVIKAVAFREGLYHHFHVDKEKKEKLDVKKRNRVCRHHFPVQLLNKQSKTTFMTKQEVEAIGLERLSEDCNLASQLLKNSKCQLDEDEIQIYSKLYAQVPIVTENDAVSFVNNLRSARTTRAPSELNHPFTPRKHPVTPKRSVADVKTDNISMLPKQNKNKRRIFREPSSIITPAETL